MIWFTTQEDIDDHRDRGLINDEQHQLISAKRQEAAEAACKKWHIVLTENDRFEWQAIDEKDHQANDKEDGKSIDEIVGENLYRWRKHMGLSQADVADRIFCSQQAYQKYEKGKRSVNISALSALASLFGTSIDALITTSTDIRDAPGYHPFAKLPEKIAVMRVWDAYESCAMITKRLEVSMYDRLYSLLDGRNRSYETIGFADMVGGGQALLVKRVGELRGEDRLGNSASEIDKQEIKNLPSDPDTVLEYKEQLEFEAENEADHEIDLWEAIRHDKAEDKVDLSRTDWHVVRFAASPDIALIDEYNDLVQEIMHENNPPSTSNTVEYYELVEVTEEEWEEVF